MKHTTRLIAALLAVVIVSSASFAAACVPGKIVTPAATPEPTPTAAPTAAPTATPTPSPSPTPTPEPYFDLENMTDEELLSAYGIPIEGTYIIGYAYDNSGLWIVEYIADDIKCITLVSGGSKGRKANFYDFPISDHTGRILMTMDDQTFSDAHNVTFDRMINHDSIPIIDPFPGELFIGENKVKNVMITRTISLCCFYKYLELQGLIVPETEWSQDIEGTDMGGNVVSVIGLFRYFLTVAPHDEVMNHIKLNYPDTAKIIMEGS